MAVVTQGIAPARTYSPFEGMGETNRLWSAVPRGLIRFHSSEALDAKPVNDSIDLTFTCSLPNGFAYVLSALTFEIGVDTASDWESFTRCRIFNGLPNVAPGNNQVAGLSMVLIPNGASADPSRVLGYEEGQLADWFPGVIVKSPGAAGHSFILQYHNAAAAVGAIGTINFNLSVYQYELNQAIRFPLNFPLPVGKR